MRHAFTSLLTAIITLPLVGCVLPFPSRTCIREGLTGRVVDARTGGPVTAATVTVAYARAPLYEHDTERQTATARKGEFRIRREYLHHWLYIFGVALNHRWPHPDLFGGPDLPASVTIRHPDYEPLTHTFECHEEPTALPDRTLRVRVPGPGRVYRLTPRIPAR
jgi:hypothetical protein